jgi:hypothetical protein
MTDRDLPSPLAQIAEVTQYAMPFTFSSKEDIPKRSRSSSRNVKAVPKQNYLKEF